jgi:hypothetical protein
MLEVAPSVRDVLPSYGVIEYHGDERSVENSSHYDVRIWTFAKGADELTVEQWVEGDTVLVTLTRASETGENTAHCYEFADQPTADAFHERLDQGMLEFGWSFVGYLPQRRSDEDRRHHLRGHERRRWWTDGALILE